MVSLTLSISISRSSLENQPTPPPQYPASLYSNHSRSNSKTYAYSLNNLNTRHSRNSSLEQLLSKEKQKLGAGVRLENKHLTLARGQRRVSSKMTGKMEIVERKKSYGIGGAGNIRRPSEVIYPERINSDGTRRRSSVWSNMSVSPGTSPDGKRNSIFSLFRRGNGQAELKNESAVDDK